MMWALVIFCLLAFSMRESRAAEERLKLCASKTEERACMLLERGNSTISCETVLDNAECAIKISQGKAHFGVFRAEELILARKFYPTGIQDIAQLRHEDVADEKFEFETVVVVPSTYESNHQGNQVNFNLKNVGFCHPGFKKGQNWNDHILKYFEQKVYSHVCRETMTLAEDEALNLKDYFGQACRPGEWVPDKDIDADLKKKYPQLCALCDNKANCTYNSPQNFGHTGALECLTKGSNRVAYSSLHFVKNFFADYYCITDNETSIMYKNSENRNSGNYKLLCSDGTTMPLDSKQPCTWYRQPWITIVSRVDKGDQIAEILKKTFSASDSELPDWQLALKDLIKLQDKYFVKFFDSFTSPGAYLHQAGDDLVKIPEPLCPRKIRWCTISYLEQRKCEWVAATAGILGINPGIDCLVYNSSFECFTKISNDVADLMTIDSNYGYLVRKIFGLNPIMYSETAKELNSFVVALVRDKAQNKISKFSEMQGRDICFPEYGGISYLSFLSVARANKLIPDSCNYVDVVSHFIRGACAPGAQNSAFNLSRRLKIASSNVLCSKCNGSCEAIPANPYFGDVGALTCLTQGPGDIAFLEARNLRGMVKDNQLNVSDFRVLCKNGTLANRTGFDVDDECALIVTIDSEVITRRNASFVWQIDMRLALMKIENALGYQSSNSPIHLYEKFNGTEDLLFKDSTTGLVRTSDQIAVIKAYNELFRHVDACVDPSSGSANSLLDQSKLIIFSSILSVLLLKTIFFSKVI